MKSIKMFSLLVFALILQFSLLQAQEIKSLKSGDKVPVFTAIDDNNQPWNINDYIGKKNIVIYFFPAAMTGGCTKQACSYRDNYSELEKANSIVVGISGDEPENLKIFKKAYNLNFPLLSDNSGEIAKKFGVPVSDGSSITREIDGKEYIMKRGVTAKRWTFTINKKGEIIDINQVVDPEHDSQNVLKILSVKK